MSSILAEFGLSLITNENSPLDDEIKERIREAFVNIINDNYNIDQDYLKNSKNFIQKFINGETVLERIYSIIKCGDVPPPPVPFNADELNESMKRKKTRTWTLNEDNRLIFAVDKYGLSNWPAVSEFVGYGRKKSQCSQRWIRVLDPKISRSHWTQEEEEKLILFFDMYGDKNWMKIAIQMGNRSDVQCRYHYQQLSKKEQIKKQNEKRLNNKNIVDDHQDESEKIDIKKEMELITQPFQINPIISWNPFDFEPVSQKNEFNDIYAQNTDINAASLHIEEPFWI